MISGSIFGIYTGKSSFPIYSAAATACIFRIGQGEKNVKEEELFGIKEDKDAS